MHRTHELHSSDASVNQQSTSASTVAHTSGDDGLKPGIARYIGGRRGFIDGAMPPVGFVAVNAAAGAFLSRSDALRAAITAAMAIGLVLVGLRLARREPLQQAVRGLVGLAIAAVFAAQSGEPRSFFLPGIWVDAAWAIALAGSIVVGRPLIGLAYAALFGRGPAWRVNHRLRRAFALITLGWAGIYATRALVQAVFYRADEAGLLAASKLLLGWPLTLVALILTLRYIRRATPAAGGSPA